VTSEGALARTIMKIRRAIFRLRPGLAAHQDGSSSGVSLVGGG
jgi:hypothetical protein